MAAAAKRNGNGSVQLEATLASSYETGKTKVAAEETTRSEPEGLTIIDPRKDFDGYYFVQTVSSPARR